MFEYTPIWLNICVENDNIHNFVNAWGYIGSSNSSSYNVTGNLIYCATTSYNDNWGIGKVNIPYSGPNIYPFGKRVGNNYYWYNTINANYQYNIEKYKYYWICLEYNQ